MPTGNSSTIIIHGKNKEKFLLKKFDPNREYYFLHEYFINKYLSKLGNKYVAKIKKLDKKKLEIFYQFFPQEKKIDIRYSFEYLELIKSIHSEAKEQKIDLMIYAKEAFTSISNTFINIKDRLNKILNIKNKDNKELINHVKNLLQFLDILEKNIACKNLFSSEIFNHADSGLHNCILNNKGQLLINDLEYAGLDSPIKQCIDYLLHPKNINDELTNKAWLDYFINNCINEKDLENLNFYFSLFALKWSIILLNEFIPEVWNTRIFAYPLRINKHDTILKNQLKKSKLYLEAAKKIIDNEKTTKLFSKSQKIFISKSY